MSDADCSQGNVIIDDYLSSDDDDCGNTKNKLRLDPSKLAHFDDTFVLNPILQNLSDSDNEEEVKEYEDFKKELLQSGALVKKPIRQRDLDFIKNKILSKQTIQTIEEDDVVMVDDQEDGVEIIDSKWDMNEIDEEFKWLNDI